MFLCLFLQITDHFQCLIVKGKFEYKALFINGLLSSFANAVIQDILTTVRNFSFGFGLMVEEHILV